jgi:hypothetical protein
MSHRSHRLSLWILACVLLAAPSWGVSGKDRSAAGARQISGIPNPALAFDPLNPQAGCEMDPNGVLHC